MLVRKNETGEQQMLTPDSGISTGNSKAPQKVGPVLTNPSMNKTN